MLRTIIGRVAAKSRLDERSSTVSDSSQVHLSHRSAKIGACQKFCRDLPFAERTQPAQKSSTRLSGQCRMRPN
jgi:hypothetical protein